MNYTTGSGRKNKKWIWVAICGCTGRIIDWEVGCRGVTTENKLWKRLADIDIEYICTDYWQAYERVSPSHRHLQGKTNTWMVENVNGRIRHYLARLGYKTKCLSRSLAMVEASLKLLFAKLNGMILY